MFIQILIVYNGRYSLKTEIGDTSYGPLHYYQSDVDTRQTAQHKNTLRQNNKYTFYKFTSQEDKNYRYSIDSWH